MRQLEFELVVRWEDSNPPKHIESEILTTLSKHHNEWFMVDCSPYHHHNQDLQWANINPRRGTMLAVGGSKNWGNGGTVIISKVFLRETSEVNNEQG